MTETSRSDRNKKEKTIMFGKMKYEVGEELYFASYDKVLKCTVFKIESAYYSITFEEPLTEDPESKMLFFVNEDLLYRTELEARIKSCEINIKYLEDNKANLLGMLERKFKELGRLKEEFENAQAKAQGSQEVTADEKVE